MESYSGNSFVLQWNSLQINISCVKQEISVRRPSIRSMATVENNYELCAGRFRIPSEKNAREKCRKAVEESNNVKQSMKQLTKFRVLGQGEWSTSLWTLYILPIAFREKDEWKWRVWQSWIILLHIWTFLQHVWGTYMPLDKNWCKTIRISWGTIGSSQGSLIFTCRQKRLIMLKRSVGGLFYVVGAWVLVRWWIFGPSTPFCVGFSSGLIPLVKGEMLCGLVGQWSVDVWRGVSFYVLPATSYYNIYDILECSMAVKGHWADCRRYLSTWRIANY